MQTLLNCEMCPSICNRTLVCTHWPRARICVHLCEVCLWPQALLIRIWSKQVESGILLTDFPQRQLISYSADTLDFLYGKFLCRALHISAVTQKTVDKLLGFLLAHHGYWWICTVIYVLKIQSIVNNWIEWHYNRHFIQMKRLRSHISVGLFYWSHIIT